MKTAIEEYGKMIVYVVIGILVLGIVYTGIPTWYTNTYPTLVSTRMISTTETGLEPVIMVTELIEIPQKETDETVDISSYVMAYEDSRMETTIAITTFGLEEVDVTKKGTYQVICLATNSKGYSFSKRVPILVY